MTCSRPPCEKNVMKNVLVHELEKNKGKKKKKKRKKNKNIKREKKKKKGLSKDGPS